MKLTGPACTEATSGAEEAGRRERAENSAGGVRVERRVRRQGHQLFLLGDYLRPFLTVKWPGRPSLVHCAYA